jgi:hypothetical protein
MAVGALGASLRPAAALGMCFLVVALCAACGGDNESYAGQWSVPSGATSMYTLLAVRPAGETYEVRFDTLAWRQAELVDGRLRLQERYAKDGMYAPELELEVDGGKDVLLVSASPSPVPVALTRLSEAKYRTRLFAMADRELQMTVDALSMLATEWATKHGGPPAPADMTADSSFGRYVAERIVRWPSNPLTGEAMQTGSQPGDFAYATDGQGFELSAVSSDGSLVSPSPLLNP